MTEQSSMLLDASRVSLQSADEQRRAQMRMRTIRDTETFLLVNLKNAGASAAMFASIVRRYSWRKGEAKEM